MIRYIILEKAIRNSTPLVEVKARRIGGSTYQVPIEVRAYRGTNLASKMAHKICYVQDQEKTCLLKLSK